MLATKHFSYFVQYVFNEAGPIVFLFLTIHTYSVWYVLTYVRGIPQTPIRTMSFALTLSNGFNLIHNYYNTIYIYASKIL